MTPSFYCIFFQHQQLLAVSSSFFLNAFNQCLSLSVNGIFDDDRYDVISEY